MSSLTLKIVTATSALGTLGTATYFVARELFKVPTIKEKLSSKNFEFIEFSNIAQWEAEFRSDEEAIKKALNLDNANSTTLKDWCKSKLDISSSNKEDLESVEKWCGIRNIISQLKRSKKTLLVGLSGVGIEEKWTTTINKRKSTTADRTKLELNGQWPEGSADDNEKIKKWCEEKSKVSFLAEEETYKLVDAWCTEEGKDIEKIE